MPKLKLTPEEAARKAGEAKKRKNAKQRENRAANPEAAREKSNASYHRNKAKNKEKFKERDAKRYVENKAAMNAQRMLRAKNNPEMKKSSDKRHYTKYAERLRIEANERYRKNAVKIAAQGKIYRANNIEKVKARQHEAYLKRRGPKNPPLTEAQKRATALRCSYRWREANPERIKEIKKNARLRNPEKTRTQNRLYSHRRRTRKRSGTCVPYTIDDVDNLFRKQKGCCVYCSKTIWGDYEIDHIMPLALGGSDAKENIQLLCKKCNRKKHAKHPDIFAKEMGRLK